jgi:hypothetical protein
MKRLFATASLFLISATLFSQQPVKINLLEYFDKVPPPPTSAKLAYDKCDCNIPDRQEPCVADSLFRPLLDNLQQIQTDISMAANTPQGDMMKKMQDPEFQKKMEAMSEEERIQLAMQMSRSMQMTPGPMKPEPKAVTDCLKEGGKLSEQNGNEAMGLNVRIQAELKRQQELEAKHNAVDAWQEAEIKKLPVIHSGGEGDDGPDPKAVFAVQNNAYKKHLAIVDGELARIGKEWTEQRLKFIQRFTPYEKALEKIHYGADAKNTITKTSLSTGQTLMVGSISNLLAVSQKSYNDAVGWYDRYVQFQKQNQQ